jgi:predicted transcriptional regulator
MMQRSIARNMSTFLTHASAMDVFKKSCYHKIDFKINEDSPVQDAVKRFTAFNIGCLAVMDKNNKVVGVCSQRDYITKIASLKKTGENVTVKEICTSGPNTIIAKSGDSVNDCMNKMMFRDIRHLLIVDDKNADFVGMISIKDLIKEINQKNNEIITRLTDFTIGKGAYFSSE